MRTLDISTWNRKEHFEFFSRLDNPFFNIVTELDCTKAMNESKAKGYSFFGYYLYQAMRAANAMDCFKMRIEDGQVNIYDAVHAGATISREDKTFGFSFVEFAETYAEFQANLDQEIEAVQNSVGIRANADAYRIDAIHISAIPWIKITGFAHARNHNSGDSVPKFIFGKADQRDGKWFLPFSIDVHHGLMDGWHVGKFLELFQENLNA